MLKKLRNALITGTILILPLGITIIVVDLLLDHIGAPSSKFFLSFLGISVPDEFWMSTIVNILSTLILVIIVSLFGVLSKYLLGKTIINLTEKIIDKLPFINTVYNTVKQIVETFSKNRDAVFQYTVLVNFPHKDSYSIGFVTSETDGEIKEKTGKTIVNVLVPTTPNPTSGFLLLVPKDNVIYLDMSVADGMKMIISCGVVTPPYPIKTDEVKK
ncbi:MAG: DUF502 domain-containing protein [Puniceicoccales bacterium]|jgi:uncharacterized membrane protein|nr:DUF502 domain-containing protein [Puniceicoccales bacterium]